MIRVNRFHFGLKWHQYEDFRSLIRLLGSAKHGHYGHSFRHSGKHSGLGKTNSPEDDLELGPELRYLDRPDGHISHFSAGVLKTDEPEPSHGDELIPKRHCV